MTFNTMYLPKLIMISGTGQNTGKTTLACKIVEEFCSRVPIIGLKISPHFHPNTGAANIVSKGENWQLFKETNNETTKDSALLLKAGALDAYFLQARQDGLNSGIQEVFRIISKDHFIVCESAGARDYLTPGVFLVLNGLGASEKNQHLFQLADRIITFTEGSFNFNLSDIKISKGGWNIE